MVDLGEYSGHYAANLMTFTGKAVSDERAKEIAALTTFNKMKKDPTANHEWADIAKNVSSTLHCSELQSNSQYNRPSNTPANFQVPNLGFF